MSGGAPIHSIADRLPDPGSAKVFQNPCINTMIYFFPSFKWLKFLFYLRREFRHLPLETSMPDDKDVLKLPGLVLELCSHKYGCRSHTISMKNGEGMEYVEPLHEHDCCVDAQLITIIFIVKENFKSFN